MKSIRTKIILSYFLIIFITIILSEIAIITIFRNNYYSNTKSILTNQIIFSSDNYSTFFSSRSLKENIANDVDTFWRNTNAEVQIIDLDGNLLMDSIGYLPNNTINTIDFTMALSGELGSYVYTSSSAVWSENLMSVAYPLKSKDEIVGVIRFITSLKKVDEEIKYVSMALLLIGFSVIVITALISLIIANSITKPISNIIKGTENFIAGDFDKKIKKISNDELGKLTDTLNFMSEEIIKNEKLKNEFIASVSHELRTPLTSIKGWAITLNLLGENEKEYFDEGLKIINDETDRLTLLVEELLDFSKLSSGKITLDKNQLQINSFIKDILHQLAPRFMEKQLKISFDADKKLDYIIGDKNRLRQALINILDNAYKFTSCNDSINIKTSLVSNNNLLIQISDTGCGIPEEELKHITKKFYKGKNVNSRNGIGLSVTKEIINMHNGNIIIESKVNIGTIVKIHLPLEASI
ncbi:sensor histidine kinase [Clostridium sp. DL1XJH146]